MNELLDELEKEWMVLFKTPQSEHKQVEQEILLEKINTVKAKLQVELVSELKEKGNSINTIWDLVHIKTAYPSGTVEVLIRHLGMDYHDTIKEGIVRSLMVKEAWGIAVPSLIREYERTPESKFNFRWIIGCAIGYLMTKEHIDWVITTVLNKSNGGSRSGMLVPLVKIKSEKAEAVLLQLLDEENPDLGVVYQAMEGLGKLKSHLGKEKLKTFLNHPNKEFRKNAQKALLKIG